MANLFKKKASSGVAEIRDLTRTETALSQSTFNVEKITEIQGKFTGGEVSADVRTDDIVRRVHTQRNSSGSSSSREDIYSRGNVVESVSKGTKEKTVFPLQRRSGIRIGCWAWPLHQPAPSATGANVSER